VLDDSPKVLELALDDVGRGVAALAATAPVVVDEQELVGEQFRRLLVQ
jgi:hypothetical protein